MPRCAEAASGDESHIPKCSTYSRSPCARKCSRLMEKNHIEEERRVKAWLVSATTHTSNTCWRKFVPGLTFARRPDPLGE
ncbi:hypothetical protein HPP92_029087 [Vanilla planifolia]|uniref:Uncharacterized protein n=1 Tax=Vanilla planifolia TaxID=51239 RepID=A0A835P6R4_VANPL|nr:hypothetical protein HPP92_029076 [Vanilla planifolia]KAG0445946.1 hypothetical protein HPP92_029087 [Vanilla planifolia]